jgi:lysophospholipase L1-like esterase
MHARTGTRVRSFAVVLLVVLGLAGLGTSSAAAGTPATYLALGDSIPFGYRGGQTPATYSDPANFVGYPDYVAADLGLKLLNASCPGETTDSFIDSSAQSNGCENSLGSPIGYRGLFPLHVDYTGSQLDYAVHVLETTPDVRLVTLTLGSNDGFLCQQTTADQCTSPAEIAAVAQHVQANLSTILRTLRQTGYTGRIVATTYYSLNYVDLGATGGVLALNAGITAAALVNGANVASGFLAFLGPSLRAGGDPVAAGLVLPGDVHPTAAGHRLLATAVEQALRF